jgi:hypothetical protein
VCGSCCSAVPTILHLTAIGPGVCCARGPLEASVIARPAHGNPFFPMLQDVSRFMLSQEPPVIHRRGSGGWGEVHSRQSYCQTRGRRETSTVPDPASDAPDRAFRWGLCRFGKTNSPRSTTAWNGGRFMSMGTTLLALRPQEQLIVRRIGAKHECGFLTLVYNSHVCIG